jgi:hypothetical protein
MGHSWINQPRTFVAEARLVLLRWRGWGLIASGAAATLHALLLPCGKFGFLVVIQKRGDFGVGIFADGLHLLAGGRVFAGTEGFHFAAPFLEQGLYLGLLIGRQGKGLGELAELAFGVGTAHLALR